MARLNLTVKDGAGTSQTVATDNDGAGINIYLHKLVDGTTPTQYLSISSAGAAKVDGSAVTQPVSIATAPALVASSAIIGKVGIDQTTPGTTNLVSIGTNGTVAINAALPAGTNLLGKVGIDQTTPGTTNLVALAANQSVNVSQINGVTVLMGAGATGTGSIRVTPASDSPGNIVDNASFTDGTTVVRMAGFIFDEVAGTALTENDAGAARMDSKRSIVNVIEDATTRGQRLAVTSGGAAKVDGSATTQPVSIATAPALVASSAIIGKVGIDQTTPGTTNLVSIGTNGTVTINAIPTGTNVIGKVGIDQTTPGTTNLVALAANQSVNVAQVNGVTVLMGSGATGTGSPRVTPATDSPGNIVDNAAFTDGATIVRMAGFIFDEVAGTALTENDAGSARMDSKRAQVFVIEDETTRGQRQTVLAASTAAAATSKPAVVALHPSSPLPASASSSTDRSTTVTTGGTAQQLMASNSSRKGCFIQNPSAATESLWISELTTAVAASPSIEIAAGASVQFDAGGYVPTGAISVIGATSTHKICAREW